MQRAGFTIIELIVLVVIALLIVVLLLPARGGRGNPRPLKDATQVRGIQQAFIVWADNNDGNYPLPSAIDVNNFTVPELGRAKDTTANIMSILICEGFITSELVVSPLEKNDRILPYENYEIENPTGATDPERALWDPKFSADFTSESGGHISYAHLIPDASRLAMWSSTFEAEEAVLSNRGPEMRSVERSNDKVTTHFATPTTRTTKFFSNSSSSKKDWWSGNVAYNDNHVAFVNNIYADNKPIGQPKINPRLKLPQDDGSTLDIHDVMFADEQAPEGKDSWREAFDANQFLGIFTTTGENREDFTAIWD